MKKVLPIARVPGEWIALTCALLSAGGIYAGLIHPSLGLADALDAARLDRNAAMESLAEAQRQHQALLLRIVDQQKQLASLGGSPPSLNDKEVQLARVAGMARDCRLVLDQYLPTGDVDTPEYSASFVQFAGRGTFPQVRSFFRQVETEMDYIDITHFTLTSAMDSAKPDEPICMLTWSCKLSGMPRKPDGSKMANAAVNARKMEVALHEP